MTFPRDIDTSEKPATGDVEKFPLPNWQGSDEGPAFSVPSARNVDLAYFCPISIGNHYYSRRRMAQIVERFLRAADASLILVCDTLRYLAYVANPEISEESAAKKAARETRELERMIGNAGATELESCRVARLSTFCEQEEFTLFVDRFAATFGKLKDVNQEIENLVSYYLNRYYNRHNSEVELVERRNIILAASISLYCTELLGYSRELYKQIEGGLQPFLYSHRAEQLREFLGKKALERQFIELQKHLD